MGKICENSSLNSFQLLYRFSSGWWPFSLAEQDYVYILNWALREHVYEIGFEFRPVVQKDISF